MRVVAAVAAIAVAAPLLLGTENRPQCGSACRVTGARGPSKPARLLVALDERDGSVLWRAKRHGTDGGHLDAKLVTHGLLIAEESRCLSGERAYEPGDSTLVAFDARTGRERWRTVDVQLARGLFGRVDPPAASVATLPARSSVTGADELLDVATGRVVGPLDAQPVAASGDLLLVVDRDAPSASATTRGIVTAIDRRTGTVRWTKNLGANLFSVVADANSVAVAAGPIPDPGTELGKAGGVEVLDPATGQRRWAGALMPAYGLELTGDRVLLQNLDHLRAVEASTGRPVWDAVTDSTLDPDLVPDGTLVTVGGPGTGGSNVVIGGSVSVFDAVSGARRWTRTFTGVPLGIGSGSAVVVGTPRRVTAYGATGGRKLWSRPTPGSAHGVLAGSGRVYLSGGCRVSSE